MTSTQGTLVLTQQIKDLVNGALDSGGNPMLLAAVDAPEPAGSVASRQARRCIPMTVWACGPAMRRGRYRPRRSRQNPHVALMYRSATVPFVKFEGRARIATDPAERNQVFEAAPAREQAGDPDRKGLALVIELDKVTGVVGFGADGPVFVGLGR